jgi:hypothetical protein
VHLNRRQIADLAHLLLAGSPLSVAQRLTLADVLLALAKTAPSVVVGRRNDLLREIRDHHYADLPVSRAARALLLAAERYERTHWRQDEGYTVCPHPAGTLDADHWRLLHVGKPPALRQLITILS